MGPPRELLSLPSVRYYISFIVINKWSKHTVLARDLAVSLSHTASLSNKFGLNFWIRRLFTRFDVDSVSALLCRGALLIRLEPPSAGVMFLIKLGNHVVKQCQ